jgi:hypothetical protein
MRNVNLKGKVTGRSEVLLRYSQDTVHVVRGCVATVSDPSGSVRLPLWNNQVGAVSVGNEIEVRDVAIVTFRGLLHIIPARERSELIIVKLPRPVDTKQAIQNSAENGRQTIMVLDENES